MQKNILVKSLALLALSIIAAVAAFASGASAIGMLLVLTSIISLGYGAGSFMNSPEPTHKK
jgi:hypothetical protein